MADDLRELRQRLRADFPILHTQVNDRPLVYFDNGATTQKPQAVVDAIVKFYTQDNANIHRGVHTLSQRSTQQYEDTRLKVRQFLNAPELAECIFVSGVTQAANLVASSWGRTNLKTGDEVLLTALEHHSNIVPWQMACEATGATLRVLPMTEAGELAMDRLDEFVTPRTKLIAMQHVSNALGTVHDVKAILDRARDVTGGQAVSFIDGAQWVGHHATDVQALGCDFYCFSAHKLFGPTGVGVLWGRRALLDAMPPYLGGGDMIESVTFEKTTYAPIPNKFEAGTPDVVDRRTEADDTGDVGRA
ncbi:MAG: aminotransferase class V-fold PLP-dependent enzyme, partial [Planctomycetota bacterium]